MYDLYHHYSLKMGCIPDFQKGGISYGPYSARWYHFSHSFSSTRCTVCSQHNGMVLKQILEKCKCCAYEVCKPHDRRGENLGCWNN